MAKPDGLRVSLVAHEHLTRRDAFRAISGALGIAVREPNSASPTIVLSETEWIEIEIPKFGEAPPLAIDVYSTRGAADAKRVAAELLPQLSEALGWNIVPDFGA